jgi:peptide/nickel transport system permease protein
MLRLIASRLALFIPTLVAASMILFIAINVVPGSAARSALGVDATPQAIMRFEALNGLDRPLYVQYVEWFSKAVRGDFGKSFQNRVDVGPEIVKRLPVTLELAVLAFLIANLIAVPLGAIAAYSHTRKADAFITSLATVLGAIPNFWLATLLVLLFALKLRWLPAGGYTAFFDDPLKNLKQMILPAISLGVVSSALLLRIMRAAMIEVLSSDYIRTARAKGAPEGAVVRRHALRNATIPYLTVGAVEFGFLFGGVVIIEDIFRLPGIGSLVLVGIINRDYPVLLGSALVVTVIVLTANMIVDIIASLLDPRQVRSRSASG